MGGASLLWVGRPLPFAIGEPNVESLACPNVSSGAADVGGSRCDGAPTYEAGRRRYRHSIQGKRHKCGKGGRPGGGSSSRCRCNRCYYGAKRPQRCAYWQKSLQHSQEESARPRATAFEVTSSLRPSRLG